MIRNKISFYGEELSTPRLTPKLKKHPLSAVRDCLFNIFAVTFHIRGRSSIRNLRTRRAVLTGLTYHGKIKIYGTLIMLVVLHGYESWSLILREVYRLSIFESRVLRKVCGPRWREVKGGLRKCHNGQLDDVYSTQNTIIFIKSKRMSLVARAVPRVEEKGNRQTTLISNTEISSNLEVIIFPEFFS